MSKVEVKLDYNEEDIKYVILSQWEETCEDTSDKEDIVVFKNHIWMRVEVDGELAGYYYLHPFSSSILQVHVNILKEYRKHLDEISKVFKEEVLKYIPDNINQLICFIPETRPNALRYALKNGWQFKGGISESFYKYGEYLSIDILGITIKNFKEQVKK